MAASLLTRHGVRTSQQLLPLLPRCFTNRKSITSSGSNNDVTNVSQKTEDKVSMEAGAGERALAGFAKALEKAQAKAPAEAGQADDLSDDAAGTTEHTSFAAMIRHSKLVQLGEISGRTVLGTITEVVGDDLYIDFGGKFHCVCPRPKMNSDRYFRGVKVKVRLNDFEMSSSFLGSEKHVTLLEADGTLIDHFLQKGFELFRFHWMQHHHRLLMK